MENRSELDRIRQMYRPEIESDRLGVNSPWHPRNPVSLYYRHAQERAVVSLLNQLNIDLNQKSILDFGCGSGVKMRFMISLGAEPSQMYAFDLMEHRIRSAQAEGPGGIHLVVANGEVVPFREQTFDLVYQFVVFSSIFDPAPRSNAAAEVMRLLKPGGILLWYDTLRGVRNAGFKLEQPELRELFPGMMINYAANLHAARLASVIRRSWSLAWIWDRLPFIKRTHLLAVLQKPK